MFNKIWNFWNDMKVPLGIIVGFTVVLAFVLPPFMFFVVKVQIYTMTYRYIIGRTSLII